MRSSKPKVLHPIGGVPLLGHVLATARALGVRQTVVVIGHGGEQVRNAFAQSPVLWAEQHQQLGTGDAVAAALPLVADDGGVLVLYGDVPLIRPETLAPLVAAVEGGAVGLLTTILDDPHGYGRIVRDDAGKVRAIVEQRDASEAVLAIGEVNTGILAAPAASLRRWVAALDNANAQGEYYLTDVIAMAVAEGVPVVAHNAPDPLEVSGVNDRRQQANLERYYQRRQVEALMAQGVTVLDPARLEVRGTVTAGRDVVIDVDVVLEGQVTLGDGVEIGPFCVVRQASFGDHCRVLSHSLIEESRLGNNVQVGPFARLRPGTHLSDGVRVGNFVEVKKSQVGSGSKINHLSYVGDAHIGCDVNVGAGTITCNYDGANKHSTTIGDGAFIGSNTALIAPVRIGSGATVGAGSTISRDVPDAALALTRAEHRMVANWRRPGKRDQD